MGRAAQIDRAAVLAAAVDIADAEGIGAVTMHAVATRLRVTPMALYRHVENKAALLDGLVEVLLTEFPLPQAGQPWDERLAALADGVRAAARRHPGIFPLLFSRPTVTAAALDVRGAIHEALREAGVPQTQIGRMERLMSTAVIGFAASEAAGRFRRHGQAVIDGDFAELQRWLRSLLPPASASRNGAVLRDGR